MQLKSTDCEQHSNQKEIDVLEGGNEDCSSWSELDQAVHELLKKLSYFQTRQHEANPVKVGPPSSFPSLF